MRGWLLYRHTFLPCWVSRRLSLSSSSLCWLLGSLKLLSRRMDASLWEWHGFKIQICEDLFLFVFSFKFVIYPNPKFFTKSILAIDGEEFLFQLVHRFIRWIVSVILSCCGGQFMCGVDVMVFVFFVFDCFVSICVCYLFSLCKITFIFIAFIYFIFFSFWKV